MSSIWCSPSDAGEGVGDFGMSFLSGLKAAYDSLEITKTFDSSKEDAGPKEEKNVTLDEKLEEVSLSK